MPLIFVYGTLKRGGSNHHYLAGQQFLGKARTPPGYRLYELRGYPGMIEKPDDQDGVTGEVWSIDEKCLAQLDLLEGLVEGLYRRVPLALPAPFARQAVETYVYARSVAGCPELGATWPV